MQKYSNLCIIFCIFCPLSLKSLCGVLLRYVNYCFHLVYCHKGLLENLVY